MSKDTVAHLLRADAAEAIPETLDLWPRLRDRGLQPRPRHGIPSSRRRVHAAVLSAPAIVIALGLLVTTTPGAQVEVSGWIMRVRDGVILGSGLTSSPTRSPASATEYSRPAAETSGMVRAVHYVPLDQARSQLTIPIRLPSRVPADYALAGARVVNPREIRVQYYSARSRGGHSGGAIGITELQGAATTPYAFPASQVRSVAINGASATYIHGSWSSDSTWDPDADLQTLSWQAENTTFFLQEDNTGLSLAELIRLAETIR